MSEQGTVHKPAPKNSTIPVKLLHDPQAKDGTIRLYAHMYWRYGQNKRNFEGQKSMAGYLRVTPATIGKRVKELEFLDWLVVVEKDYNPTTGNYTTPHYHLFLSQSDCRKFRDEYVPQTDEHIRPKPAADEIELRKSRKGAGRKGGNPEVYHANSGLDGGTNSGLAGRANSGLDELIPSYPTEVTNVTSSKTLAPGVAVAVSSELDEPATSYKSQSVEPPGPDPQPVPMPEEKVKKVRPPSKWEGQHDALLTAFGLSKEQVTKKRDSGFWSVAYELYAVHITAEQIPALYTFVKHMAESNQWKQWTEMALVKYAPNFLANGNQKQTAPFAVGINWVE